MGRDNVEVWVDNVRVKSAHDADGGVYLCTTNEDDEGDVYISESALMDAVAFVNGEPVPARKVPE